MPPGGRRTAHELGARPQPPADERPEQRRAQHDPEDDQAELEAVQAEEHRDFLSGASSAWELHRKTLAATERNRDGPFTAVSRRTVSDGHPILRPGYRRRAAARAGQFPQAALSYPDERSPKPRPRRPRAPSIRASTPGGAAAKGDRGRRRSRRGRGRRVGRASQPDRRHGRCLGRDRHDADHREAARAAICEAPCRPQPKDGAGGFTAARRRATLRSCTRARRERTPVDKARLKLAGVITGEHLAEVGRRVAAAGYVTAQNMMYRHTVTVYDAKTHEAREDDPGLGEPREARLPGVRDRPWSAGRGRVLVGRPLRLRLELLDVRRGLRARRGATAARPRRERVAASSTGSTCRPLAIDRAYRVGAVPKVVAVTPDDRFVLVSNWCTWDLSVISTRLGREVKRIPIGPVPARDRRLAEGQRRVRRGDGRQRARPRRPAELDDLAASAIGAGPRALAFHPSDRYVFATLNAEGRVAKLDLRTGAVRAKVATGSAPRSMAIAADGRSLYVVNYESGTVDQAPRLRHEHAPDDRRLLPPDRDHLRPGHQAASGSPATPARSASTTTGRPS